MDPFLSLFLNTEWDHPDLSARSIPDPFNDIHEHVKCYKTIYERRDVPTYVIVIDTVVTIDGYTTMLMHVLKNNKPHSLHTSAVTEMTWFLGVAESSQVYSMIDGKKITPQEHMNILAQAIKPYDEALQQLPQPIYEEITEYFLLI